MPQIRVYELAAELGIESKVLLANLVEQGHLLKSTSSTLTPSLEATVRARIPMPYVGPGAVGPRKLARRAPSPVDAEVTTAEAAAMCRVSESTIRQWVRRGHLKPVGKRGRSNTFLTSAVWRTKSDVYERTPRSVHFPRLHLHGQLLERLITDAEAAVLLGISPSTIRMWVSRGRLTPTGISRPRLFRAGDVVAAARDYSLT